MFMEEKLKEIIIQVGNIGEKVSNLLAEESLPSIDIDLILSDIRSVYEKISDLKSETIKPEGIKPEETGKTENIPSSISPASEASSTQAKAAVSKVAETPVSDARADASKVAETPVSDAQANASKVAETAPEIKTADSPSPEREKDITEKTLEIRAEETSTKKADHVLEKTGEEPTTLGDKYKGEKKFINERLAEKGKKQDISSKIQSKPIQNISSSMGINDRFKLINDLFNGDKDSYQNTISILDGASNFNEAFNYITSSFDWDLEEDSAQKLLELVRRKFIVNQNE